MKAKKIAIAVLLSLVMIVSSSLVVACDNNKENRWDILTSNANLWSVGDRNIYDINTTGGKLVLDYTKTDTYQYVSGPLGAEDKGIYNTFVLTASMTTTAEWSTLLVKFGDGAGAREFNFELSSTEKTYEIDVSDYDLESKEVILLFADAGWRDVTGKITISEMYLTDRDINEANRATAYQLPAGNPLPETAAWNHITSEKKTVNAGWYDDGRGIYKVDAQNQDGSYTVHGKRKTHQEFWYNALLAFVYSDAETMSAINSFKLTVKAPAGTLIAVKPFDFYEVQATVPDDLDNEEFTIEVDVSGFTQAKVKDEQDNPTEEFAHSFAKTDKVAEAQAQNKIYVIWETGIGSAKGDFTIVKAEFSTDKAVPMYTAKEITETDGKVSTEWFSYDFGVYTPSLNATDNSVNVHYVKGNLEWPYMYTYVKGAALQNMTTLTIKVKGPEGVGFLVKPYDQQKDSYFLTFTGSEQTEVLDISGLNADWNSDLKILFFVGVTSAGGGEKGLSGDFTIYSMEYGKGTVTPEPEPEDGSYPTDLLNSFNSGWTDADGNDHWTISGPADNVDGKNGVYTLSYIENNSWSAATTTAKIEGAPLNYVLWEVKGTTNTVGILSVEFSDQKKFEAHFEGNGGEGDFGKFTGEWQTVAIPLDKPRTGDVTVRIFAGLSDQGVPAGEIKVSKAQFMYVAGKADTTKDYDANGLWLNAPKDGERCDIEYANGKTTVTYAAAGWDSILAWIDLGEGGYDHITITFKGLQGHSAIIKVGTTEKKYEGNDGDEGLLTGEEQTVTIDVSGLTGIVEFRIFLDMNSMPGDAGSFEITQALFCKEAA